MTEPKGINKIRGELLVVTNMYPSESDGRYGIFVKKAHDLLSQRGLRAARIAAIRGKPSGALGKIAAYLEMHLAAFIYSFEKKGRTVWLHYPSHGILPLIPALLMGRIKLVINFHGSDLLGAGKNPLSLLLTRIAVHFASASVVPSEFFRKEHQKRFGVNRKIIVFPSSGVDMGLFRPTSKEAARSRLGIEEKGPVIGYVSSLLEKKGIFEFIEALEILRVRGVSFYAVIVGDGPERQRAMALVEKKGLNGKVLMVGQVSHFGLAPYFNALDLFVFPTKFEESLGLVALEALSCGVPVITSRRAAMPEYVRHGLNGWLVDEPTPEKLAEGIEESLKLFGNQKQVDAVADSVLYYEQNASIDRLIEDLAPCL